MVVGGPRWLSCRSTTNIVLTGGRSCSRGVHLHVLSFVAHHIVVCDNSATIVIVTGAAIATPIHVIAFVVAISIAIVRALWQRTLATEAILITGRLLAAGTIAASIAIVIASPTEYL